MGERMTSKEWSRRRFLRAAAVAAALPGTWRHAGASALSSARGGLMASDRPSATAQGAAILRAAHQVLDDPRVFVDPLATKIIGLQAAAALVEEPERFARGTTLRASVALRSRYAEDQLSFAVNRGVWQYVLLGAGLDTFAYRSPHYGLQVFEVDHPATQRWKQWRLEQAGIAAPAALKFAPVDFEVQTLADGLRLAGFRRDEPAFFSMLGVAIYLTKPALMETLRFVSTLAPGSGIVFSYSVPSDTLPATQRLAREAAAARVAAIGEPWISYYDPVALAAELRALGFSRVRDFGAAEANRSYFGDRDDGLRVSRSGRLMTVTV
jgi:methyltransferase (TIGR00027 family)